VLPADSGRVPTYGNVRSISRLTYSSITRIGIRNHQIEQTDAELPVRRRARAVRPRDKENGAGRLMMATFTAGTFRRLARVMAELGWTAVRVRDLTRGGYKEQVRGYCRASTKCPQ
jgi:hypothetical protein